MSDVTLLSWIAGHGLAMETRAGAFEIIALKKPASAEVRDALFRNGVYIEHWPELRNSRTAKYLIELYRFLEPKLRELNERAGDADPTEYRRLYWELRQYLTKELDTKNPPGCASLRGVAGVVRRII